MKQLFYTLFLLFPILFFAQGNKTELDSVHKSEKETYINDHTKQLNIKFEVSNDIQRFKIPFDGNSVKMAPNLSLRYAFVFSYKFASIRLGIRPKATGESKDEKGDPNSFRFRFKLLFSKWSHNFEYNKVKGYYITNSEIFTRNTLENIHVQLPKLTTEVFEGSTAYKLNNNYSIRATISQTEVQLKSAGSFIPSIDYSHYNIYGLDTYLDNNGDEVIRSEYIDTSGFTMVTNIGYYYTFVYKKWYANGYVTPGIGIDFNNTTSYTPISSSDQSYNNLVLSLHSGLGIGYNTKNIFSGVSINSTLKSNKTALDKVTLHTSKNTFFVFFGYRFKAPKTIAKPIDDLEEKIPISNKDN